MFSVRRTLVYLLIFTVVSSFVAYRLVLKAYGNYGDIATMEAQLDSPKR